MFSPVLDSVVISSVVRYGIMQIHNTALADTPHEHSPGAMASFFQAGFSK
jgi:hypothetical protein